MKSKINSLYEKYYLSILQFFNKDNSTNKISLILDPSECLLDLTKNITLFLEYLWEKPDFIAKIIINSHLNDSKNILFPLIFNRFYQNIFSQNFIEQNLLYVVTIILRDEINKKEFDKLIFEENSKIGCLLDEFRNKIEIKKYVKNILFEVIKKIEFDYSEELFEINFDKFDGKEIQEFNDNDNNSKNQYLIDLTKAELEKFINGESTKNMNEYISQLIKIIENNNDLNSFSNGILREAYPNKNILFSFNKKFMKIIELLDLFLNQIENEIIPIELKYLCKTIYLLIKYKFPKLKTHEIYFFIGKNIFMNLLIPFLKEPSNIFLHEFLISKNTLSNLNFLLMIFSRLITGELYKNKEKEFMYTPFNFYFMKKMNEIFWFFENIINVELPKFIELFIMNKLDENYIYDYFNENKNEIMLHKSILFSLSDIICLLKNIEDNKDILFTKNKEDNTIESSFENKILNITEELNKNGNKNLLINLEKMNNTEKNINLILFHKLIINPKYDYLSESFNQKKEYFYIKELSKIQNEEDSRINNIIRIKNYINYILYNCQSLSKFNFSKTNFISIFSELKNFLKYSEKNIYFEYNINSLLECLKKLEDKYSQNDFELILNELSKEINESINMLDFQMISDYLGKMKICEKKIELVENTKILLKNIDINKKLEKIIFEINNDIFKYELIIDENKKQYINNIEQFIKYFPNIKENRDMCIKNYLDFVFTILEKEEIFSDNEDEIIKLKEKIYDYIFIKLYEKIFPQKPSNSDLILLMNCEKLSWVEVKHCIKNNFDFDIFMNEIIFYFDKLEKERNPKIKFNQINLIFEIISKVILFIGFDNDESEDEIYIGILKYIIIQIKPKKLYSDLEYIQLFSYEQNEESLKKLELLRKVCDIIKNIKYSDFLEINEEEFKLKCEYALQNNIK